MRTGLALATALLVLLAACGQPAAHRGATTTNGAAANPNSPEAAFVSNAAMFETYAIRAAEIAQSNGQSDAVKAYAAGAVGEHRTTLQQLAAAARARGLPAPDGSLDDNYEAYLSMLQRQSPQSFDATYASQLSIAYLSASGQYDTFAASAEDSPLRDWAQSQTERLHEGIAAAHALAAGTSDQ